MTLRIASVAETEVAEAINYYDGQVPGLGAGKIESRD